MRSTRPPHSACISIYLCSVGHRPLFLSGLHHVSVVVRSFIDAKRASVLSQSRATWTTRDEVGKLRLDCVMRRGGRGTMTFFLVK